MPVEVQKSMVHDRHAISVAAWYHPGLHRPGHNMHRHVCFAYEKPSESSNDLQKTAASKPLRPQLNEAGRLSHVKHIVLGKFGLVQSGAIFAGPETRQSSP